MNISSHLEAALGKLWAARTRSPAYSSEKKLRAGLPLAIALLVILGLVSFQTMLRLWLSDEWETKIETEVDDLGAISSELQHAEAGDRGYLITGDERYLEPYRTATQAIDQKMEELLSLSADNPILHQKIDMLTPMIATRFSEIAQTNELRKYQGFDSAARVILAHHGQPIMNDILQFIGKLKDEQDQLLQQQADQVEARALTLDLSITFGSFLAIMLATLMISRDIIHRKRADAALRESAARFHRLAENALDMIYRYRLLPTPTFEYVSRAATVITGYTPEDFYTNPGLVHKLIHPEDRGFTESLELSSGSTEALTMRWIRKDGTVIWIGQQLVPIYDPEGNLVAIEGIVRDTTERVRAYQMLEQRVEERTHEIERRRQAAEGLRDILTILNSNRPLEEILDSILAQACRLLGTNAGAVYQLREHGDLLVTQVAHRLNADETGVNIPIGWGSVGQAVLNRQPMIASDALAALPQPNESVQELHQWERLTALFNRYRAVLAVPLVVKDDIYGAIALFYYEPRDFTNEEIELAVAFGDQAALAIENARLRIQAEQTAAAAERSRLARDLHDAVTQTLFSSSLIADVLPRLWERDQDEAKRRLAELRQLTRAALAEMRSLLLELRPATLAEVGLGELLRLLTEVNAGRVGGPVSLTVDGQGFLPANVQVAMYRIAQEALNNVGRHAQASHVAVSLCYRADATELQISDDGCGFDPSNVALEHLGLRIMRERADALGAELRIVSHPEVGTQVTITWPRGDVVDGGSQ